MTEQIIPADVGREGQRRTRGDLRRDYESLGERLDRRGISIDAIRDKVAAFHVAIPSWGVGTGGTRFARFPGDGEPRDIFDKIEDCAVIQQLTRATPTVSLHIPWDKADPKRLKQAASRFGLGFDAMNSNTFADAKDQTLSYKYGSLSHADAGTRKQAVEHNLECIEIGRTLGSKALTVWIGDGSNFPGQVNFAKAFERYLDSMREIYAELPDDWRLFTEHKMYEPAFYSTVVQDWGTNYIIAQELGAEGLLPRRPRPPRAERQHRDDRLAADPVQEARRLPLQRFEIWRRRPRHGLDRPLPAVPRLQRAGRCRAEQGRGFRPRAYARPEPQRHRPDRKPDAVGGGGAPRLRRGAAGRPQGARRLPGRATTR